MLTWFKNFNFEKAILVLISLSFFIGIWHALPMLGVIADEMYFVGGVLRAMENYSLIPAAGDVPYGTITYFLNYILIGGGLIILLPFFGLSLVGLKQYLVQSPELVYLVPRFLSALTAVALLLIFNKILQKEFSDKKTRLFLLILVFTNLLVLNVLHTGKVWVLSVLFLVLSFYYLLQVFNSVFSSKNLFLTILFAALAAANFPLFVFALMNVPILLWHFRRQKEILIKIIKHSAINLLIFIAVLALNFEGIKYLVVLTFTDPDWRPLAEAATVPENLTIWQSVLLNIQKIVLFFPLLLVTFLAVAKNKIRNKNLFWLSLLYSLVYFYLISAIATWSDSLYTYTRYLFPLGFLLPLIIFSFKIEFKKIFYLIGGVAVIYGGFLIYYLAVPTTFNQAHTWVINNLNQDNVLIYNKVWSLELPKNKASYIANTDYHCATKCQNVISQDLNLEFKFFVVDKHTQEDFVPPDQLVQYNINSEEPARPGLIKSFVNPVEVPFGVEGRLANYLDFDFFKIKNFGPNIYIYQPSN